MYLSTLKCLLKLFLKNTLQDLFCRWYSAAIFFPFLLIYASHITMPSFKSVQLVVLGVFPSLCDNHNYSKSPASKSSSCELSKMQTCFHVSSYQVRPCVSVHRHACTSCMSGYAWLCFTVQYCVLKSSTVSSIPGCPETCVKAAVIQLDLLRRDSYVSGSFFQEGG